MEVSQLRNRIGRIVLGALGGGAILAGALGLAGIHSTGSRVMAVMAGVGAAIHGLGLLRIARRGEVPASNGEGPHQ